MRYIFIMFLVIAAAGCRTSEVVKEVNIPRAVPGTQVPIEEFQRVRYGENIKTFAVNRYIDPANPDIMYERTVIYRVEQGPTWNTLPAKPFTLPSDKKVEYVDVSSQQRKAELEIGLKAQKKLIKGMDSLTKTSIKSFKALLRENIKLTNEIVGMKKEMKVLKKQINDKTPLVKTEGKEVEKGGSKKNTIENLEKF